MLNIQDLDVFRGRTHVLHSISMKIRHGEIVALIGANGAGKTTTLQTISSLIPVKSGSITYRAEKTSAPLQLTQLRTEQTVACGICHCPEGRGVFGGLSVYENLLMGAYLRSGKNDIERDIEQMYSLFPILGARKTRLAGKLSGGEQMMLAIGRALMGKPRLLILDEPSLGLAPKMVDSIFEMLERINNEGVTVLLVEQNAVAALELASRAYVLETGHVVMQGDSKDLIGDDSIRKAYLGG